MANKEETSQDQSQLTPRQIVRLSSVVSADNMESIAEGYLNMDPETIKNIRHDASNSEAFNRNVIRYWGNRNQDNQVQVSGRTFTLFRGGSIIPC